jgi:ADP-ribose pyrophosphatase
MEPTDDFRPTQCLSRRVVVQTPRLRLFEDQVRFHTGHEAIHWKVDYTRQGVGIIPVRDDGRVILGLHWRYCSERWSWEIAAGGLEPGEDFLVAAARELEEETGHRAESFEFLLDYFPAPGLGNEHFHVFLARGLSRTGSALDAHEIYDTRLVDWTDFEHLVEDGAISDGFTLTAIYMAKARGLIWREG